MARVGLVGGLGPESTVDYYRRIIEGWKQRGRTGTPSIVIDSIDAQQLLGLSRDDRHGLIEYLMASLTRLEGAGVDFAALTANTPHLVFDDLAARSSLPLISIVDVCAQEARRRATRASACLERSSRWMRRSIRRSSHATASTS